MNRKLIALAFLLVSTLLFVSCENLADTETDDPRDNIVGTWNQWINNGTTPFAVQVTKDASNTTGLIMFGFDDIASGVNATYVGSTITIVSQSVNGEIIEGTGIVANDYATINFTYSVDDTTSAARMEPASATAKTTELLQ